MKTKIADSLPEKNVFFVISVINDDPNKYGDNQNKKSC